MTLGVCVCVEGTTPPHLLRSLFSGVTTSSPVPWTWLLFGKRERILDLRRKRAPQRGLEEGGSSGDSSGRRWWLVLLPGVMAGCSLASSSSCPSTFLLLQQPRLGGRLPWLANRCLPPSLGCAQPGLAAPATSTEKLSSLGAEGFTQRLLLLLISSYPQTLAHQ